MYTAAIIAGGQAKRLGGKNKSELKVGDARIIDRQIKLLSEVADHLLIVANDTDRYRSLGVPIVEDLIPGMGALGGIYTATMMASTAQTLVIACDMPFLTVPFLRYLEITGRKADIAIPKTTSGYQPLCASYSRRCVEPIRRRIENGELKVSDLLADVKVREIRPNEIAPYDPDGRLFFNINTPEDYRRSLELYNNKY